ncbi:ABC transporter permease [Haloferacaceae archaeon DSL9]
MSWRVVARKDFEDAVRSRWLLGLTGFFILVVSAAAYFVRPAPGETVGSDAILTLISGLFVTTIIPLIALVISYNAVSGERESGSLKLLLSLPHSRADLIFGKVLGRAAALAAPLLVGFILPAVVLAIGPFQFEPATYLGYTLFMLLLGLVFVSIAVGFSAAVRSQRVALVGAIGLYFLFVPLWNIIQMPLQMYVLTGGLSWLPIAGDTFLQLVRLLNPNTAFQLVSAALLYDQFLTGDAVRNQIAAIAMLLWWILAPPLFGYWRFERADL